MIEHEKLESIALKKFRPLAINLCLHEEDMYDENLVQWLRARDYNCQEAAEMLRKSVTWRIAKKMDRILVWEAPKQFLLDFPYDMKGEDKQGCPVFTIPIGKWDIRKAYQRGQKKIVIKYVEQLLERGIERTRLKNLTDPAKTFINQCVFIWDMEGLTMRQLASTGITDLSLAFVKTYEEIYPGILKNAFIVNAPKMFPLLFSMLKPLLSKRTMEKAHIFGTNADKWKDVLRQHISMDQLLEHYGGFRGVDINYRRIQRSRLSFIETQDDIDKGMVTVTVEANEKIQVALDVLHPNSTLRWKFYTVDFDIGFYLVFQDKNLTLINRGRVDSHKDTVEGSYTAVIPGRYILIFDNTYCSYQSKSLHYTISETQPDGVKDNLPTLGVLIHN